MSRRKDPAAAAIDFFEHAPVDAAQAILGVCKSIVKRRQADALRDGLSPAKRVGTHRVVPSGETSGPRSTDGLGGDADGFTPAQAAGFSGPGSDS